jgi:leader peptidase (prepilin peptidase)/N-methyltransferase
MGTGVAFVLGLAIGSFLNVCIYRLPAEESIVHPRSRCPRCGTELPWWANIPVASWLALRGRCAFCTAPIALRYPLVELLTGVLFAAIFFRFGMTAHAVVAAVLASALVAITFIDIDHRIIPDVISLPGIAVGFAASWIPGGIDPMASGLGALFGGGVFAAMAWLYAWWAGRGGLGMGDIKLLAMIGAFLGWTAVPLTILIASVSGSAVGIPAILWRGRHLRPRDGLRAGAIIGAATLGLLVVLKLLLAPPDIGALPTVRDFVTALVAGAACGVLVTVRLAARRFPIPFGPFLALGAFVCMFLGPDALDIVLAWVRRI